MKLATEIIHHIHWTRREGHRVEIIAPNYTRTGCQRNNNYTSLETGKSSPLKDRKEQNMWSPLVTIFLALAIMVWCGETAWGPKEVGGTLIGENRLVVMTGAELVEWYQIHQTHEFQVFDAIPVASFRPVLWAALTSAASGDGDTGSMFYASLIKLSPPGPGNCAQERESKSFTVLCSNPLLTDTFCSSPSSPSPHRRTFHCSMVHLRTPWLVMVPG